MSAEGLIALLKDIDTWIGGLKPRWIDLVGDYAGEEFFVVDGDSLCQKVLDDELVAIGGNTPRFQILHGIYCLEQAIYELKRRECNFEITFFECNKHGTILTGSSDYVTSSRLLAREIMKSHIVQMTKADKIGSALFQNLEDPEWLKYVQDKRPMFALFHIGPTLDEVSEGNNWEVSRVLIQRTFFRDLLISRLAVATLNQIEYIGSKALTFVYERQRVGDIRRGIPRGWNEAIAEPMALCETRFKPTLSKFKDSVSPPLETRDDWLIHAARDLLSGPGSPLDGALTFLFVGAQLSLPSFSLNQRAQYPCRLDPNLEEYLISDFFPRIFRYLSLHIRNTAFFPDLDGNVFLIFLKCRIGDSQSTLEGLLGPELASNLTSVWSVAGLEIPDFAILSRDFSHKSMPVKHSSLRSKFKLLPFSHPVFDKYLPSIVVENVLDPNMDTRTRIEKLCDEQFLGEKPWHNGKSILPVQLSGKNDTPATTPEWRRMKQLWRNQRFIANLQRHAQTLTGAKGQPIQPIVILESTASAPASGHSGKRTKDTSSSKSIHAPSNKPGKGSKSKAPQLTSSQKLKAKIEAEKQNKKSSDDDIWWKLQLKELEAMDNVERRTNKVDMILRGKRAENGWLAVEVSLYRLHLTILAWLADENSETEPICEKYTVCILQSIHELREHPGLFPFAAQILAQVLIVLGFDSIDPPVANLHEERELGFKFIKLFKSKSGKPLHPHLRIKISPSEFQLKAYGAYMDRSMDSKPDPRVLFEPDGWQREVLDKIDRNESMLVIAPTSAGKTFSSFYAMEKVLRESSDGVIVYVSPTKALCHQIAADVYARFSKNMPGRTVWAIDNRDFRIHDPLKAQILVTVPEVLSNMLLSPLLARDWVPRIKYIILDEIHSIGKLDKGHVWEHIILLSNCPILGLSATIGAPEAFSDWVGTVQKQNGRPYSMIEHQHRYSHLRKYAWQMPEFGRQPLLFGGFNSAAPSDLHLRVIHPMSALLLGGNSIPPDLALESHDCLNLYSMMTTCVQSRELEHLHPSVFFSNQQHDFLKQYDVIRYEEALKDVVGRWAKAPDSDVPQSPYQKLLAALQADMNRDGPIDLLEDARSEQDAKKNFIHLLHKLDSTGDLPCLAFDLNRFGCERYGEALLYTLEQGEATWRASNPRWAAKLEQWESWKMAAKSRQREAERASRRKQEDPLESQTSSVSWQSSFDPDDPSPEFSFANTRCGYSKEDFEKDTAPSKRQRWPDFLVPALRRGIGIHHAGMPREYRSLVESLFRIGYCRVVISTSTLALGINAPAKSAIFIGDSAYLSALMYRQCSGRSGRRGFDMLGKVIFYNLPLDRVHRLLLSRLPPLTGNWPLTTTLCLRLFNLLSKSDHAPSAVNAIDSLMRLPRLSISSDRTRLEVLHYIRFSIEYLRRLRLLSEDGSTTALYGAVGRLYYEEPGNLAFATLVRKGIIHRLCSTFRANKQDTEKNIVHLVATLFARLPVPYFTASRKVLDTVRASTSSPSLIVLPPLPDYINQALEQHNRETLQVFSAYATTYVQQHLAEIPDNVLPLSLHPIVPTIKPTGGHVSQAFTETSVKDCVARSLFVSNSGKDDEFQSIPELCHSTRAGLHLDAHSAPNLNYAEPANAYALDYWQHESLSPLLEANKLRLEDVWLALQNFYLTLSTLSGSLHKLLIERGPTELQDDGEAGDLSEELDGDKPDDQVENEDENKDEDEDEGASGTRASNKIIEQSGRDNCRSGVTEEDRLVCEAFRSVTDGFFEKWLKMWA